ncbi:hypothetical protein Tco_1004860 [Tanacetum coccineum]|uniref:Uncharacterized protein n=1 Tax=Tanacetum coccineum TaxID=301880 RepID=A0ABQ5FFJ9_9ASTR
MTTLAGRRWFLTYGIQLAVLKCFKSPEYQGILGHALGRAVDFGMQGLELGMSRGCRNPLSVAELKSQKDCQGWMRPKMLYSDGPLADLPEAAHLQPCLEQLSIPIHHSVTRPSLGDLLCLCFAEFSFSCRRSEEHAAAPSPLMKEDYSLVNICGLFSRCRFVPLSSMRSQVYFQGLHRSLSVPTFHSPDRWQPISAGNYKLPVTC